MTNEDHSDDRDDLLSDQAARAAAPDLRVVCGLPAHQRKIEALLSSLPCTAGLDCHVVWSGASPPLAVRLHGPFGACASLGLVLEALGFAVTEWREIADVVREHAAAKQALRGGQ